MGTPFGNEFDTVKEMVRRASEGGQSKLDDVPYCCLVLEQDV